ncbi:MAG: tRNA uridine-5-carboxymethylaminomethyl(34) synthesis GTPase MnmE [Mariprofundaceae bacterium]|nr:tRNA uridine-5-carboxymethylaminomethyl(34) synthesis GTPase MnmE [Mariprofundaceae bacterium]
MPAHLQVTVAAIATPAGRGGIGIIRLSGAEALPIAMQLTCRKAAFSPRTAYLCRWLDADGHCIDEGIVLYFAAPASYTGEDVVELQGHGSQILLQALLERCFALGCVPAAAGEFTRRAVLHGRMDLSQAEGVIACIDAATQRAAKQAQRHLAGEFGDVITRLMDRLMAITAHAEACLDFPEEEIPPLFLDELQQNIHTNLLLPLAAMLCAADFGERLFNGATAVIVGAPNVGKSSLLNVLSGRDRAIVNAQAGTTRDVLEVDFEIHGIPVRLLDTAGLRSSNDAVEQEGVSRAYAQALLADVVLFVADASRADTWTLPEGLSSADIYVINKTDAASDDCLYPDGFLPISVRNRQGIEHLMDAIATRLGDGVCSDEAPLITRARHRDAIKRGRESLQVAVTLLADEATLDLATLQLRCAHAALAEIVGRGDIEHILDRVFSEFCVGK